MLRALGPKSLIISYLDPLGNMKKLQELTKLWSHDSKGSEGMLAKFPCPVRCTVLAQEGMFGMLVLFEQCSGVLPRFWPRLVAGIGSLFFRRPLLVLC